MSVSVPSEDDIRRILREEIRAALGSLPKSTDDRRVNSTEAAAAAGVSPATIKAWCRSGLINRYGEGRGLRYSLSEVLAVAPSKTRRAVGADEFAAGVLGVRHG